MLQDEIDEALEEAHFQIGFYETGLNGSVISWKYWVQQMPILSAGQAARLMAALDPDLYVNLNKHHGNIDPTDAILKATKIQQLAETSGKLKASPAEWLTWAQSLGLSVHDGFRLEVLDLPVQQTEDKPKLSGTLETKPWEVVDPKDPKPDQPWYTSARYFARELVKGDSTLLVKRPLLADKVTKSLAAVGIFKRGNKLPPAAGTVLRALSKVTLG